MRDWLRPELCTEALRLGRILAGLMPQEAEVHGLGRREHLDNGPGSVRRRKGRAQSVGFALVRGRTDYQARVLSRTRRDAIRRADVARYYSPKYAPEKAHAASKPVMTPRSSGGR